MINILLKCHSRVLVWHQALHPTVEAIQIFTNHIHRSLSQQFVPHIIVLPAQPVVDSSEKLGIKQF